MEVYLPYYQQTMQHKALKLMASKLAVAGIIEGSFSEEGLAAMSECEDMTTIMAKELMLGIKDSVEDVAESFKRMALLRPDAAEPPAAGNTPQKEEAPRRPEPVIAAAGSVVSLRETRVSAMPQKRRGPAQKRGSPEFSGEQIFLFQIA